ncbi:MAG: tail tape measure protein [Sphingomonadales bacterium]|nr:tail tape measure protein [Sphingomonadales bacterium]MBD3773781.1 tail tape measure protein [Paracoccaceae bacterium]
MDGEIDQLLVEVRASTQGFAADIAQMRGAVDANLVDGFARAGDALERGLLSAIRKGSLGFDDLKRVAFNVIDQIAAQALQAGIASIFEGGSSGSGGLGGLFGAALGSLFGLPGRATGGPVSPGAAYLVGERGPEVFVPTSAGRIENGERGEGRARDVRVAITLAAPRGTSAPVALQRSSRQVASAIRRSLRDF